MNASASASASAESRYTSRLNLASTSILVSFDLASLQDRPIQF